MASMSASRAAACPFWHAKWAHVTSSVALMQASDPASARHLRRNEMSVGSSRWSTLREGGVAWGFVWTMATWRLRGAGSWAVRTRDAVVQGWRCHLMMLACPAQDARCIAVLPSLSFSSGSGACRSSSRRAMSRGRSGGGARFGQANEENGRGVENVSILSKRLHLPCHPVLRVFAALRRCSRCEQRRAGPARRPTFPRDFEDFAGGGTAHSPAGGHAMGLGRRRAES